MRKILLVILLLCSPLWAGELRVGVGRAVITPQGPIWMSGYAARNHPSEGVVHDLWARALAVDDGQGGRAVIVTTDLLGLPRDITDDVATRVAKKHSLRREQVLFSSTHTHGGPVIRPNLRLMYSLDEEQQAAVDKYREKLAGDLTAVIASALADLAPARLDCGHGSVGFAMNRREPTPKGIRNGMNPDGPVDHDVPVLRVATPEGKLRAVLFGYACHNTTLGGTFYRLHGDYAGFAEIELEKAFPGSAALFMILCGGDQNPQPRGTPELAEKYGKSLAEEVRRVLVAGLKPVRPPVRTGYKPVALDLAPHDRARFEAEAKDANRFKQRRAEAVLRAYDEGRPPRQVTCPVQAVRFGDDFTLLAIGGEVVVDYALRLKRELASENLMVAGYCNDVPCYIASRRMLAEGGYEVVDSMIYYGQPGPLAEDAEATLVDACRQLVVRLGAKPPAAGEGGKR